MAVRASICLYNIPCWISGLIWTKVQKGGRNQNLFQNTSADAVHVEAPVAMDKYHEVLLMNRSPKLTVEYNQIRPRTSRDMHEATPNVEAGSILVATEKLLNVPSFGKSTILIVSADQNSGFQGLIINKLISWDSLPNLDEGLELLKQAPLSFGGPVIKRGLPLVSLARRVVKNEYPEVLPGCYFLDQFATVHEIESLKSGDQSVTDYWFFLGYSSWGWEQLFDEIAEGAWNLTDNNVVQLDWPHYVKI